MEQYTNDNIFHIFKVHLLRFSSNFKYLCDNVANQQGYSLNFCNLLYFIVENEGMTLAELSKSFEMDKGNLSRLLNELIDNGYVEKQTDTHDNRRIHVYVTDKGKETVNNMNNVCIQNLEKLLDFLPEEEFTQFLNTLSKLDTHVHDIVQKKKNTKASV